MRNHIPEHLYAVYAPNAGKQNGGQLLHELKARFPTVTPIELNQFLSEVYRVEELNKVIVFAGDGGLTAVLSHLQEASLCSELHTAIRVLGIGNGTENIITSHSGTKADKLPVQLVSQFLRDLLPTVKLHSHVMEYDNVDQTYAELHRHSFWLQSAGCFTWGMLRAMEQTRKSPVKKSRSLRKLLAIWQLGLQFPYSDSSQLTLADGSRFAAANIAHVSGQLPYFSQLLNLAQLSGNSDKDKNYVLRIGESDQPRIELINLLLWDFIRLQLGMSLQSIQISTITGQSVSLINPSGRYSVDSTLIPGKEPLQSRYEPRYSMIEAKNIENQTTFVELAVHPQSIAARQ